jgi:hypothetical protein
MKYIMISILFLIGLALGLIGGTLILAATSHKAHASPQCLTKVEAQQRYGDVWLYWHTDQRCWDDRRSNSRQWPLNKRDVAATALELDNSKRKAVLPEQEGDDRQSIPPATSVFQPPAEFNIRWPDTATLSPARWLRELEEFGGRRD